MSAANVMEHPGFFERAGPFPLHVVATRLGCELPTGCDADQMIADIRALDDAGPSHLSFIDNRKYVPLLQTSRAAACLVAPALAARIPQSMIALLLRSPYRGFAQALSIFYPEAMRPKSAMSLTGEALVHPSARIEAGVQIEPGAVVGREAWIGSGTTISAGAVIGYRVTVGRDSYVGPNASIIHALIGDRVIIHGGVRIGQDGFGFAMGPGGHLKVPQIGRVIVQNDVEIGANSAIDRGALKDTTIGEGTKIDNLVQIGHNVVVGTSLCHRWPSGHCWIICP